MNGNGYAWRELRAAHKTWRLDFAIGAVHGASKTFERKINRKLTPGRLFDGIETRFRKVAQGDSDGRIYLQKAFVVQGGKIDAEPTGIIGQEECAAYFGIDGVAKGVRESEAEGKRREMI